MKTTTFPLVLGNSAVFFTAKKCQTLDEYSKKTVRGAMGCDVLTILEYGVAFFLIENSIVSEQEMVNYACRKS